MRFATYPDGTDTIVRCDCGEVMRFCNDTLCAPECPSDCERREEVALVMAAENHECGQCCPGCPHPPHAGWCYVKVTVAPSRLVQCRCKEKAHVDRPSIPSQRGPGAAERCPGVPDGVAESLKALSAALDEPISGGPSMRDLLGGAARRGEGT